MTKAPVKTAAENIKKLEEKDGEANNESARTNEILASREAASDIDPVRASIEANDPSLTRAAYTSHESGFNEDLSPEDKEVPHHKAKGQTKAANK